ncbi:hypothetical protein D6855_01725 [Butyrivibrio sp. CB08]|uniref:cache domain-containing sensor histidine kinase n=1 Tax=Butyrivibrio sp. CB08 TaxID=2364879 RepID=UPI000EAA4D32|nr:sensor histidine kinase [Butyrivibrio sp. CB08]RKM62169.1 hypothetical protein D6855_01725 [Butyrivibrio sp. CB08]
MSSKGRRESKSKKLVFSITILLCIVYFFVFVAISGTNYVLKIRSENQNNRTYLCNTLTTLDDKIKDISRVSLMTMADDNVLDIISTYRDMDEGEKLSAGKYLRNFYSSLTIIRNDISGIYIMDNEDMIFHFDDASSTPKSNNTGMTIPEQIAAMEQEPMLLDNCRIIIDKQPHFMRFNGEYVSNPYYSVCLWMVRDIYSFSPHEKIGEIVLTAPVDRLNYICSSTLQSDYFYLLSTQNGRVICSMNPDELLLSTDELIGDRLPKNGSGYVNYGGVSYYATSLASPDNGLRLIVGRNAKSIVKDIFRFVPMYLISSIIALIIVIIVTNNQARLRDAQMREQRMTMLYLKSQINPHFLYNTLDTIRISAEMNSDLQVADMLMKLVSFFRLSMRFNQSIVTIEHELDLIENYLALMHYRYTDIESSIDCEPDLLDIELPNFILQPVVENSILHGLRDKGYSGKIEISVHETEDDHIELSVSDNGIGMTDEARERIKALLSGEVSDKDKHSSIGLQNVQHRLKLFYDESCGLSYKENPSGGITAIIRIRKEISNTGEGAEIH